jgi:DNA repair exonuclease SbcCD ATPase subunit
MTDPATSASGGNPDPSGTPGTGTPDPKPNDPTALDAKNRELLAELKSAREKLAAVEAEKKKAAEEALKAKEDWKTIAETREQELKAERERLAKLESDARDRKKLAAFLDTIADTVPQKYWGHIDLEAIAVNPDSGVVDPTTVAKEVERFKKEYPELIHKRKTTGQPSDAPKGGSTKLSREEWLALPLKEMKARAKEVLPSK